MFQSVSQKPIKMFSHSLCYCPLNLEVMNPAAAAKTAPRKNGVCKSRKIHDIVFPVVTLSASQSKLSELYKEGWLVLCKMDKKGQTMLFGVMVFIFTFVTAVVLIDPMNEP